VVAAKVGVVGARSFCSKSLICDPLSSIWGRFPFVFTRYVFHWLMNNNPTPVPVKTSVLRTVTRLAVLVIIILVVNYLLSTVMTLSEQAGTMNVMYGVIFVIVLIYILLMATPFVPGIEIGLTLMFMRGDDVVIIVYFATVAGLMLAFFLGRYMPYRYLHRILLDLRLTKACAMLVALQPLNKQQRLEKLRERLPKFLRPLLVDYRYVLVAAVINVPGNALIGGGGGIMMVAGLSRVFTVPVMLVTVLIAVSPVPLLVLLFNIEIAGF
jgi:hypothetical protein